jgi:hypothetical protein
MATVTVGAIGGVMTDAGLKTALDAALGADLQRLGASTSRIYRCVDNLRIQGDVTCGGFTFICANGKNVAFVGSSAQPGYLRGSVAVSGAPLLPIRIIHEGLTGWNNHLNITPDVHGYLIHCRADVQSLEISVMGSGSEYSGVPICTAQPVVIHALSVESLNIVGAIYVTVDLANAASSVRFSKLRLATLRIASSGLNIGFVGDLGWVYGESATQALKLLSPNNSVFLGFAPKFVDSTGVLELSSPDFSASLRTFRDSFLTPLQIGLFPVNNDSAACHIERTVTFLPQTPEGTGINEVSTRVLSTRTILGSPGVSAGAVVQSSQTRNNGDSAVFRVWRGFRVATVYGLTQNRIDDSALTIQYRKYDRLSVVVTASGYQGAVSVLGNMPAASNLTLTQAQAAALTGIAFSASGATGGTLTITEPRPPAEIWAAYRVWIAGLANFDSDETWEFGGVALDIGAWSAVIDGVSYTGDMTTTGVITLANGATFNGTRTDANGTVAPPKTISITGITAGSRLQIYNVTTATEIVNAVVVGTSYASTYNEGAGYSAGDTVRVRLTYNDGLTAKLPYSTQTIVGAAGWSVLASQQDDAVYAALGIDGSTVTEFIEDFPNIQIDVNDPDGMTRVDRLYAWFVNAQSSSADGLRLWFGGIVPEDDANFRIATSILDLKIDNHAATGVAFVDGRRLYRDDGASPLVNSTTGGGSITMFAGKVYTSVVSTASPVITGDISQIPAAVQTGMTAQGYTADRAATLDKVLTVPKFIALK